MKEKRHRRGGGLLKANPKFEVNKTRRQRRPEQENAWESVGWGRLKQWGRSDEFERSQSVLAALRDRVIG